MEDEVVARSFRFHYRDKASNQEGEIEIQFMETEDEKGWKPQPAAPKSLLLKEAEQGGETDSWPLFLTLLLICYSLSGMSRYRKREKGWSSKGSRTSEQIEKHNKKLGTDTLCVGSSEVEMGERVCNMRWVFSPMDGVDHLNVT